MATLAAWGILFLIFASCVGTKTQLPEEVVVESQVDCPFKLDMALNSVDDMYDGCETEMQNRTLEKYLQEEQNNTNFEKAWEAAEIYYNNSLWNESQLSKNQIKALHAYTLSRPQLYQEFNKAVREQKAQYQTDFHYHTLHFYLTMALRSLKYGSKECVTSYRRTPCKFQKDVVNKKIRFGFFTSSSIGGYSDEVFGTESCFEIYTCFGADISPFSKFENEKEVLIPPYEVFKVTEIEEESTKKLPCKVVYKLRSTRKTRSYLNCDLFTQCLVG
ncbi:NAD(P)(+)--arginine ADP-ribosyltransferase 1-like isoform X1 [Cyprinodon tularosa]|uniref:NAD(P)(+)--arginine ADP-ribosyltransferase 1-like isoform X1 n=1 Tax=Cyprinodon tularosa TaxID=77115 RepID=UPI0018E2176F|nr:NAD(P)(+)--arginine ADP-ribosyltransferase 1-like isoform X1 [Cyprinodon tularosa]